MYHRRERTEDGTTEDSHVDFLNLIVDIRTLLKVVSNYNSSVLSVTGFNIQKLYRGWLGGVSSIHFFKKQFTLQIILIFVIVAI